MKFVLIILASGYYKGGPAAIPGYSSVEECRAAGRAAISETIEGRTNLSDRGFFCVPAPR